MIGLYDYRGECFAYTDGKGIYDLEGKLSGYLSDTSVTALDGSFVWHRYKDGLYNQHWENIGYLGSNFEGKHVW